jgi:hypothetical protein
MAELKARARSRAGQLLRRSPRARLAYERLGAHRSQLAALRHRVGQLEAEVQEARALQQRVAELTDVVAEVLVPLADRDDERLKRALDGYARTSF